MTTAGMNTAGTRDLGITPPACRAVDAIRRQRGGMTLVEIMVTIAVIGVLVGLLLPALGVARESARRTSCSNHISQLALGMIAHDMERSSLPGWRNSVTGYTTGTATTVSWTVPVLPFVGENELYDWYREFTPGQLRDDISHKRVGLFVCPSAETVERATISYMGNAGTGAEDVFPNSQQHRGDGALVDTVGNTLGSCVYPPLRSNLDQITLGDGVAGTLLLIERCGSLAPSGSEVRWTASPQPTVHGSLDDGVHQLATSHVILHPPLTLTTGNHPSATAKSINPNPVRLENPDTLPGGVSADSDWRYRYPSSRHKGGVTAAFCDGHVRFLGDKIAPWVYCQLLTAIKKQRSERARTWEQHQVDGTWVPYILDDADLVK